MIWFRKMNGAYSKVCGGEIFQIGHEERDACRGFRYVSLTAQHFRCILTGLTGHP